ncbi:uncharacterized protein LY89DRAFT_709107 [Mollisia scopiformis]|uniref:Zn(2)-C6 fungal-type domain-containing protein n=1 Tax=Mollisia scopiformis TaxID=149040 RepID=A0A194X010_MOLSC|nr:uncharacterized protein LY89DRAFT_709107 [Mollisia scopiformis]KUJ13207.1 hypothetical protein LY89DRAFT_709107 [Mollisia scopiformis]
MTRRSHRKSRSGCSNCKQRRIKCDEQKPSCQRCSIREEECTYPLLENLVWVDKKNFLAKEAAGRNKRPSPSAQNSSPQDGTSSYDDKDPSLNLDNIELVIHWFTTTVHTVNPPSAVPLSQTLILNQAMQHHFLLHGLLALSALHLADSHVNSQLYTRIATAHHTRGLSLYDSILSSMDGANYSASIAFSSITAIFALGISRPQTSRVIGLDLVDDLIQVFQLSNGWRKVVQAAGDLKLLPSSTTITSLNDANTTPCLSLDTQKAFDRLHALNQGQDAAIYSPAISALKSVFATLEGTANDNPHVALDWAGGIPEGFLDLVSSRYALALVIVAHYCVVLHRAPRVWWLRGWGEGLFGVIWRLIDPAYREPLDWVRKQIGFAV